MKYGIELNGVANISIILDSLKENLESDDYSVWNKYSEDINSLKEQVVLLERYMIAYCQAVNAEVPPPYWHEIRMNPKLFPTNRETNNK